jgi:hypothetical protein
MEVPESRAVALLKEAAVSEAEKRAACITLAGLSLAAADGNRRAARRMLRAVLEVIGVIADEPPKPCKHRGIDTLTTNYERPGRSS